MIGVIIGYDVSLADLGAGIVTQVSQTLAHQKLRVVMLTLLTVAITPLCLVSRIQSLVRMSAFAMVFYTAMLLHMVFVLGSSKLLSGVSHLNWLQPSGLIQCIPIFFGSLFCQTQLLTVYTGLHQPSVSAMHDVVQFGVGIITVAYGLFGFMGYLAFADSTIPGNVFLLYPDDSLSFGVQAGFLFTITVSIPLTLFPLRRSVNSFIYHQQRYSSVAELDGGFEYTMPAKRFRLMTIGLLVLCFSLSLTTDKIEVIIQLTSSLAGSLIGYILPSIAVLSAYGACRSAKERRIASYLLLVGICLFVIGLCSVSFQDSTLTHSSMSLFGSDSHSPQKQMNTEFLPYDFAPSRDRVAESEIPKLQSPLGRIPSEHKATRIEIMKAHMRLKTNQSDHKLVAWEPNNTEKVVKWSISTSGGSSQMKAAVPVDKVHSLKHSEGTVFNIEVQEPKIPVGVPGAIQEVSKEVAERRISEESASPKLTEAKLTADALKSIPVQIAETKSPLNHISPIEVGNLKDGSLVNEQLIQNVSYGAKSVAANQPFSNLIDHKLPENQIKQNVIRSAPSDQFVKLSIGSSQLNPLSNDSISMIKNRTGDVVVSVSRTDSNEKSLSWIDSSNVTLRIPVSGPTFVKSKQSDNQNAALSRAEPVQVTLNISNPTQPPSNATLQSPDASRLNLVTKAVKQSDEVHVSSALSSELSHQLKNKSVLVPVESQFSSQNTAPVKSKQNAEPSLHSQENDNILKRIEARALKSFESPESKESES
ncbi:putative sodium-coupled neutral amino acid transporter 10 [Fasciola gigantica]|uniref:Putative sodium-coupled neutral amino acid transporter 10 n=1 Tax=Fasciola gigantica TaxID=46835 RepID=A0A504YBE4_FASGI|nr:putative sodium-coupled neutral amino acid transporter 10 [Fasciola gigantica]